MKVFALAGDLLSKSRLREAFSGSSSEISFVSAAAQVVEGDLLLVDLNAKGDPIAFIAEVRSQHDSLKILAFGPHVDKTLLDNARNAGASEVLPRSKFYAQILPTLAA